MTGTVVLTAIVYFTLFFAGISGRTVERYPPPPACATIMCEKPCPRGQYLAVDELGCETCDCYDPCENFKCEVGECHWMLDERTRPLPFCVECTGGQIWSKCTGGSDCVATCANPAPICNRNCFPGCQCPRDKPILYHGQCIREDECRDACEGGQQWTECGVETAPTCRNLQDLQETLGSTCVSRCQCPSDRPVWDTDRSLCVTQNNCLRHYYMAMSTPGVETRDEDVEELFNWQ